MREAAASLANRDGAGIGTVTLTETPNGVHVLAELRGLPEGTHAFHIHETGACSGDFTSAGGHFNPTGSSHGFLVADGPHLGDMPNIHVPANGALTFESFVPKVALAPDADATVFDSDNSAIVIHQGADDYKSQPSGAAGPRIGCGTIAMR